MDISSQSSSPIPPDRRIDITRPNRDAIKQTVADVERHASDAVDSQVKADQAKRIKDARDAEKQKLAERVKNAREEASAQTGDAATRIKNAREAAQQNRIQNARDKHAEAMAERIHHARGNATDKLEISYPVSDPAAPASSSSDVKVKELKALFVSGKLNTDERVAAAADKMLRHE